MSYNSKSVMNNPLALKAVRMYLKNFSNGAIARELNVHKSTVGNWLRTLEAPRRAVGGASTHVKPVATPMMQEMLKKAAEEEAEETPQDEFEATLDQMAGTAATVAKHEASLQEDKDMMEIAEAQQTPADKYQHYVAAAGIKLLRDSMRKIRGPKTVKELSELDQLIRRNLGLGSKGGNGSGVGSMQIDISILNNQKADSGKGTLKDLKESAIDAEILKEKYSNED